MNEKASGITVIDLFCGGGGFSEGFHQAGYNVVYGIDNWKPACDTHTINGLGETDRIDLLKIDVDGILNIKKELEIKYNKIDIVIGSPPCTEFSYAKKAGRGDIEKGMLLVRKHLLFVTLFKPKYWLMENVPRLESVLNEECDGSKNSGWTISYEKLGIPTHRFRELGLEGSSLEIPYGEVFTASDFGAPENRKRFIAGNFPIGLMNDQKVGKDVDVSLGGLLKRLKDSLIVSEKTGFIEDPNYRGHFIRKDDLRDYNYNTSLHPMYWEEMRHLKRRHIQYGRMNLPEDPSVPARTIMATATSSSRESLIFETDEYQLYQGKKRKIFRQPKVREVACIQGFPLDFQLVASRLNDRYKLIGNAVPCQLSYALAKAISTKIKMNYSKIKDMDFKERAKSTLDMQVLNNNGPIVSRPVQIVDEAIINGNVHKTFKAKPLKNIRRKLLSSKLEQDSSVVIFENADSEDGKVSGSLVWKACIQRGMGSKFYKVYIDETSISNILLDLSIPFDSFLLRKLVREGINEVDKGAPKFTDNWSEFPGWLADNNEYLSYITAERINFPATTLLQKAFTTDVPDLNGYVGPIDIFDSIDAIMLLLFNNEEFLHLKNRMIRISHIKDNNNYPNRIDPRIINEINNTDIPLVTLTAATLNICILIKMYEQDEDINNPYYKSLIKAKDMIKKWCKK
ncbi:DNA cytosine methyltransferase [Methanooceanicella nereidis]|nr:DNA cytosine methyltransferase [Methanocella sp. CWC-04]